MDNDVTPAASEMTLELATEFGHAWNSYDADLVASYFAPDGSYHASVGDELYGISWVGRDRVREGVQAFWDRYPGGRFENLVVKVAGGWGTLEWDFVWIDSFGVEVRTAGCDLLEFRGDKVTTKNAFRKNRPT